jgi:hypothetical protein
MTGDYDQKCIRARPILAYYAYPIALAKREVHDNHIRVACRELPRYVGYTKSRDKDSQTVRLAIIGNYSSIRRIIIDDEDARRTLAV